MHPEVQMANPGKCPKCGMALVAKKITAKKVPPKKKVTSKKPQKDPVKPVQHEEQTDVKPEAEKQPGKPE